MKLNDVKHDHSLTDLLKILIFSILMMIPFIDVGVRCAYVVVNKNAYQSYSGQETIQYEELTNTDDLVIGQVYTFNNLLGTYTDSSTKNTGKVFYSNLENVNTSSTTFENYLNNGNNFIFYYSNDGISFYVFNDATAIGNANLNRTNYLEFQFILQGFDVNSLGNNMSFLRHKNMQSNNYLDNVFDYSVNKLTTNELYTWTQQTAIYTGVQTMCAQLGINNTVIPLLLVYWFILTIIYIIIDIVLKLFTMLTHAIGSKTA